MSISLTIIRDILYLFTDIDTNPSRAALDINSSIDTTAGHKNMRQRIKGFTKYI